MIGVEGGQTTRSLGALHVRGKSPSSSSVPTPTQSHQMAIVTLAPLCRAESMLAEVAADLQAPADDPCHVDSPQHSHETPMGEARPAGPTETPTVGVSSLWAYHTARPGQWRM